MEQKPQVWKKDEGISVVVRDHVLGRDIVIQTDLVVLASGIVPHDNASLAQMFKLSLNEDGFFMEAHAKLRPVEFATDGIFLCGLAHYPKAIEESISQAMAAASRATTILAKDSITVSPLVSYVDTEKCDGCGVCTEVCSFGAIILEDIVGAGNRADYRSKNIMASCKGCGLCAASCPQKAIDMLHFRDQQIIASLCAIA